MTRRTVVRSAVAVLATAVIVVAFIGIDSASHSVSDTLIGWLPMAVLVVGVAVIGVLLVERLLARRG